ncbi:hypothetical protein SUGI_1135440 [Cryptomeria japonica]|nr:hypothetical protein SUGI_1135440 [Cryptomeria japonica]
MAYFESVSCVNCEDPLDFQIRYLFHMEDFVYDALTGLFETILNDQRHWCDVTVYVTILLPLANILECKEKLVVLLDGFIKPDVGDLVVDDVLQLPGVPWISILKGYFKPKNHLPSDYLDSEESSEDSSEEKEHKRYFRRLRELEKKGVSNCIH